MSGRVPPSSRAGKRSRVKSPSAEVRRAASLYERFSGHEAEAIGRIKVPALPKVGVSIGEIDGVLYTTVRDGRTEKYIHKFAKNDRPLFVVSPDGRQLFMIGGRYRFTELGIVDASDKKHRNAR
jgi:hypothetical protein